MLHKFDNDITARDCPEKFTYPYCYEPHPLVVEAARSVRDYVSSQPLLAQELQQGKMLGVLVVQTSDGSIGFLAGYSGVIHNVGRSSFFVPPVCDLLRRDGFFRPEELRISAINDEVNRLTEGEELANVNARLKMVQQEAADEILAYKEFIARCKEKRRAKMLRASEAERQEMVRESQYQNAELKRLKLRHNKVIQESQAAVDEIECRIEALKAERKSRSIALQRLTFDRFVMLNALGESKSITKIFADSRGELPPSGAGDCAAPKMLQYAFRQNMKPLAMGEFWIGQPLSAEVRRDGHFYPSCTSKCKPILDFMLRGLIVEDNPLEKDDNLSHKLTTILEDEWLWVVNKPAGMLSVPGKSDRESVESIARCKYPAATGPLIAHRLDMHTSGILIVAKTAEAFVELRRQFNNREIHKQYVAIVDGNVVDDEGEICLPLSPDHANSPQQMVDFVNGKAAVTRYKVIERLPDHTTRILFSPLTGRTHQLRVHASHSLGLNAPIHGDMLYGKPDKRLCLHAMMISFKHPVTNEVITLGCEPDF